MSPIWIAILGASLALNVVMGYQQLRRAMWKAKKKYGTQSYGGRQNQRGRTKARQPRQRQPRQRRQ